MNNHSFPELREGVRQVVTAFDSRYWQEVDEARAFPEKFVTALTQAGWLAGLIPEEYGGAGLSLTQASVVMEEINRAGGNSGACHGQMYVMGCIVRHGTDQQKQDLLPRIARGEIRMQSMAVTEPSTGSDTTKLKTTAVRKGDGYWLTEQASAFVNVEAASLMRYQACELFDAGIHCGAEANMSKLLAADASWEAANVCLQTHGGFGFAAEYDIERKFRETRLYQVAPILTNMILSYVGEHVLGMPRSY